jgi:hypothetical protein
MSAATVLCLDLTQGDLMSVSNLPSGALANADTGGCCGGKPSADASACCALDEAQKAAGQAGCGCGPEPVPDRLAQPAESAEPGACCGATPKGPEALSHR